MITRKLTPKGWEIHDTEDMTNDITGNTGSAEPAGSGKFFGSSATYISPVDVDANINDALAAAERTAAGGSTESGKRSGRARNTR